MIQRLRHLVAGAQGHLRPAAGPFDCVWCAKEGEHGMCTGKAVRPHLEGAALFAPRRTATAVEDCACALRGHGR